MSSRAREYLDSRNRSSKKFKVTNSYGVKDALKYYRHHRTKESEYVLLDIEFLSIIRETGNLIREALMNGEEVMLPERMGKLELRKIEPILEFKNDRLITTLPVDWKNTIKLWEEDEQAFNSRQLVRHETKVIYKVHYNRYKACYNNKTFYKFLPNRFLKRGLKKKIDNGDITDAPLYRRY